MKKKYLYVVIVFFMISVISIISFVTVKAFENKLFDKNDLIILEKENLELLKGETSFVKVNGKDKKYFFESNNENVVEVNQDGEIFAKNCGTAEIIVKDSKDQKSTCSVTVLQSVEKINIVEGNQDLILGEENKLSVNIEPSNAVDKSFTWKSSDDEIVSISEDGTLKLKKSGKVIISVETSNKKKDEIEVVVHDKTYNKELIFIGDSITQGIKGTPENYSWANYIGDNYDVKSSINAGKSGWYISNGKNKKWIRSIIKEYKNKKFDYVILHGGINDIHFDIELGIYNEKDFSGKYNTNTVLGGLEKSIYTIKKQWPNAKIGFIVNYDTPLVYPDYNNKYNEYYTYMKKVLDKWNIKYIDLYAGSTPDGIKYSELLKVNSKEYLCDGLHLNKAGYDLISPYIYDWINTL